MYRAVPALGVAIRRWTASPTYVAHDRGGMPAGRGAGGGLLGGVQVTAVRMLEPGGWEASREGAEGQRQHVQRPWGSGSEVEAAVAGAGGRGRSLQALGRSCGPLGVMKGFWFLS